MRTTVLFWCLYTIQSNYAANILGLFIHPGFSHFHSFYPILNDLAERGHNLTVVTFFSAQNRLENYHEILLEGDYPLSGISIEEIGPSRSIGNLIREYYELENEGKRACDNFYRTNTIVNKILNLHSEKPFDLTISEVFNTDCQLGVVALLRTPIVGLSSCALMPWHYDRIGLPDFPAFVPSEFVGSAIEMDFTERLINFFIVKFCKVMYSLSLAQDNQLIRFRLGIDIDLRQAVKNTSLILVNQHYSLSGSRPLSSRIIEIGGAHIPKTTKTLPNDLENFLNSSKDGIIFISWGSLVNCSSLPMKVVNDIITALSHIETKIIWKWESDRKPIKESDRILFTKWTPQFDLLCHPKVKLFWTHGGLLGTTESVHCAVPMVITPMYGDQYLNAKAVQRRKMGEILPYEDINEENVYNIIMQVLQPSYATNAKYISDVFRNRQNPPLDTAIWWIEHIIHTKGNNLTYTPSVDMNWFVYNSLDVITVLFAGFVLVLGCIYLLIKKICLALCCRQRNVQHKMVVKKKKKSS